MRDAFFSLTTNPSPTPNVHGTILIEDSGMLQAIRDEWTGGFRQGTPLWYLLIMQRYKFPSVGLVQPAKYEVVEYKCDGLE
jgi:hypothetical protein